MYLKRSIFKRLCALLLDVCVITPSYSRIHQEAEALLNEIKPFRLER